MTRQQIFWLCVTTSFFLHMWVLDREWGTMQAVAAGKVFVLPAEYSIATASPNHTALVLEQAEVSDSKSRSAESAARRRVRQAQKQYLQQVHAAIEHRKFTHNGDLSSLLGNALYSFTILPDDTFIAIRLRRSSGDPLLDEAALAAIRAASGKTKRPKIIAAQTFRINMAVKYQLNM